jgi:hypothetical protein
LKKLKCQFIFIFSNFQSFRVYKPCMSNTGKTAQGDVYLTDLPDRVVGGFKAARGVGAGWVSVEYTVEDVTGAGLATGYGSGAKPLTLNLGLTGVYTLHLALGQHDGIRVWLDGDPGFREFMCEHGGHGVQEARLHAADLTGRRLHIAPIPHSPLRKHDAGTFLLYVRAVAESGKTMHKSARNLIATNDGFSWIALDGMESIHDVTKNFTPYRDSDFFRMLWCPLGADVSGNHMTKVGTTMSGGTAQAYRRCDRQYALTTRRILRGGGDILATAAKSAKDVGMEFWFYLRPEAFYCHFPHDVSFVSRFFLQNQHLRCVDEFGNTVQRLSYAYKEVQEHMLAYIAELLKYRPGGICLAFNRSLPMMIAEPPVVAAFVKRYGRAPVLPGEIDGAEMAAVRDGLLQGFLDRLKSLLDKKKVGFSCIAHADHENHRIMGLDLARASKRGLFESICVTSDCTKSSYWKELKKGTGVRIYPGMVDVHAAVPPSPSDIWDHKWQARTLKPVIESGFDGAFFWDAESLQTNPYNWHVIRKGGSPKYLERVMAGEASAQVVMKVMSVLRGARNDRYKPGASY